MVITDELKSEVMQICVEMLGENASGIYVDQMCLDNGDDWTSSNIYTDNSFEFRLQEIESCGICQGVTKIVLFPHKKNYVIKIGITNTYQCTDNYNDDVYDTEDWSDRAFFNTADEEDNSLDKERTIYDNAPEELKKILLPTYFIGKYNGIPIYIQEKIDESYYEKDSYNVDEYDTSYFDINDNPIKEEVVLKAVNRMGHSYLPDSFIYHIVEEYGEEFTRTVLKQIDEESISDLHGGNIGYVNKKPIIFDYAGYCEEVHWY